VPVFTGRVSNFDISPALQEDFFGFRFTGGITVNSTGTYVFYTASDDGSLLYINGDLIVDNDGLHASVEQGGSVELDSGTHEIEVRFFEKGGGAALDVYYEGPGTDKGVIPDSVLTTLIEGGELVPLEGIAMPESLTLPLGETMYLPLDFNPSDASDRKVDFVVEDTQIALLNFFGQVKGIAEGVTNITGSSREGGFTATSQLIVINDTPLVTVLAPENGQTFLDTSLIQVSYMVIDSIGGIISAELFLDGNFMGESETGLFVLESLNPGSHEIQVKATDIFGTRGESESISIMVESASTSIVSPDTKPLGVSVVPNPFTERIQFNITLASEGTLYYRIYDIKGALLYISAACNLKPGATIIEWDGKGAENQDLSPGTYICRFCLEDTGGKQSLHRVLIKK
jgi:hypothetical protein